MIKRDIADCVLTVGPSPDMQGGIAQVLDTYFSEVFECPKFVPDTVKGPKIKRMAASAAGAIKIWWRLLTDRKIRIVHLHTAHKVSFPRSSFYARIARAMGRKVIFHMHGSEFRTYYSKHPAGVHRALSKADAIVALSNSWKSFFANDLGLGNVTVIKNVIATPHSLPTPDISKGRIHALFLGALGERKGIFDLLEALHRRADSLRGRLVLHVGGNGEVDRFKRTVSDLGLSDMVSFHGWITGADKQLLLNRCSIFILPSYAEGLPISILEAMAYGNAVISTPVGGIPELVSPDTGILVDPGDIDALADAVVSMVTNPGATKTMGGNARSLTAAYLPEAVAQSLEKIYDNLLSKK